MVCQPVCVRVCVCVAYLPDSGANPGAVVIKPLNTVVVDAAVVGARRLVDVARVVVSNHDLVTVDRHLLRPAHTRTHRPSPFQTLLQASWPAQLTGAFQDCELCEWPVVQLG